MWHSTFSLLRDRSLMLCKKLLILILVKYPREKGNVYFFANYCNTRILLIRLFMLKLHFVLYRGSFEIITKKTNYRLTNYDGRLKVLNAKEQ